MNPDSVVLTLSTRRRTGIVALELALVMPIFLLSVFGIVEIGRAIMVQQILTNGAREGARRAVLPGATNDQVNAVVDNYLANTSISGFTRSVTPDLSTANSHDELTVSISVPYDQVSFGLLSWLGDASLQAAVVMRKE